MTAIQKTYTGILAEEKGLHFLLQENGTRAFAGAAIWAGYVKHWSGMKLCARLLSENDYETGKPVALMWPCREPEREPFIELYYNERLVRYFYSFLGHAAINVNGEIFNFSHLLNECEVMSEAEYFYRPALGKFAPRPGIGYSMDDPSHPYLDKFGRQFMRTIHVARITGFDTEGISAFLHSELDVIHSTPEDPARPGVYRDFSILRRSCSTIIRDALRSNGMPGISGVFPGELFMSAVWNMVRLEKKGRLVLSVFTRPQLMVDEAAPSAMTPLLNPVNIMRRLRLKRMGINP